MKKLIALALSILLGSTGYVIVDHTLNDRVGVLESQVESLNGVVSSLENEHTDPTTSYEFAIGENIPVTDTQKYSFDMIHYTAYWDSDSELSDQHTFIIDINNRDRYDLYNRNIEHINDFSLDIDSIDFECISIDSIPTTVNNATPVRKAETTTYKTTTTYRATTTTRLTTTTRTTSKVPTVTSVLIPTATLPFYPEQRTVGIKVICSGTTSAEYAGKEVLFELKADNDYSTDEAKNYTSIINSDGSFTFEAYFIHYESAYNGFESCELINPTIH